MEVTLCAVDEHTQNIKEFHEEIGSLEAARCTINFCQESFTKEAMGE